jgi:hypothetical protein
MKFVTERPLTDPDAAARKLVEIANAVEAVQDGRIYIERVNGPFLEEGGTPDQYRPSTNWVNQLARAKSTRSSNIKRIARRMARPGQNRLKPGSSGSRHLTRAIVAIALTPIITATALAVLWVWCRTSPPHPTHTGANVHAHALARRPRRSADRNTWPTCPFEQAEQALGNESGSRGINVPVALGALAVSEEPLRHDEM